LITIVGGTSGIGESTARELVQYSTGPRIYLIGRSQDQADRIETKFASLNPARDMCFIQSDASQLRNVDSLCDKIKAQEEKIDVLLLSAGIFHLRGR
jgi:NADP-dependent 3-hydroxy acid dehydrogenase YdfG